MNKDITITKCVIIAIAFLFIGYIISYPHSKIENLETKNNALTFNLTSCQNALKSKNNDIKNINESLLKCEDEKKVINSDFRICGENLFSCEHQNQYIDGENYQNYFFNLGGFEIEVTYVFAILLSLPALFNINIFKININEKTKIIISFFHAILLTWGILLLAQKILDFNISMLLSLLIIIPLCLYYYEKYKKLQ